MEKLKTTKILGIVGNALIILGVFLPMFKILGLSSYSLMEIEEIGRKFGGSGMSYGIFLIIIAIVNFVIIFSDKLIAAIPSLPALEKLRNQKITVGTTILVAILFFLDVSKIFSLVTLDIGFWVLMLGIAASVAYPFIYKGDENNQ